MNGGISLSISNNYVELYTSYINEIDDIRKNLKLFKIKKSNALKKGIFASDEEVYELEKLILGEPSDQIKEKLAASKEEEIYVESQKEELAKNENLADIVGFLDDSEEDRLNLAKENDMVQIYRFSNGDMYIGRLLDGKLIGIGSYIFQHSEDDDSSINTEYIGNFVNGVREGRGSFTFSNGNEYIGNFKANKSDGIGRIKYNNGDEYLGNWIEGRKEGLGIYTWSDGYIYIGDFKDGKMDGNGSCFNSKGELIYDGEWKLGQIHGKGKYIWNRNKWYEGDFQQGEKHGEGTFYLNGDPVYQGTWKFDKPSIFDKSFEDIIAAMQ